MFAEIGAIGTEEKSGAVEGASFSLGHTHDEENTVLGRHLAEGDGGGTGDFDRGIGMATEGFAPFGGSIANDDPEIGTARIPGEEDLGEDDQFRALGGGIGNQTSGLVE